MLKKYCLNSKTLRLHIVGLCRETRYITSGRAALEPLKLFETEEDAIAYAGAQPIMCKWCAKKRDDLLKKDHD